MPNPKRQHSKQRSRKRRTHQKISLSGRAAATVGNKAGCMHRVDPVTGCYKGKQIIDVGSKVEETPEGTK